MAITITVYPYISPRIIEIDGVTYSNVSIQDLYDAVREWEDSDANEDDDYLIDAAGKEALGGGVTVGITATLNNTRLLFKGNTTPLDDGSGRTCDATDLNGRQLYVNDADFITANVSVGDVVFNDTTGEMATVTEIVDQYTLNHLPLQGYGNLGWTSTDLYKVYENIQCVISGGNLVAVDSVGADLEPILQSPLVQVVRTSSSSATLQELSSIQFSSFNGGVTYDSTSSYTGTSFPVGTPQQPVNNLADAMLIVAERGFNVIFVTGDATIDSGDDYTDMTFIGESMTKSTITISSAATVTNCEFYEMAITGTLDGNAKLKNCRVQTLNYIYGVVEQCMLGPGTITLGGADEAHFLDCWSGVVGTSTPIIDMGGSGQDLALRNYNGGIKITNKTGTDKVSIDLNSGQVVLDSTVTNGTILVRGIGHLTDNSVGATVETHDLLSNETIADAVWDETASDHTTADTMGYKLNNVSAGSDPTVIATEVWSTDIVTAYGTADSAADVLKDARKKAKLGFYTNI